MNDIYNQLKSLGISVGIDSAKPHQDSLSKLAESLGGKNISNHSGELILIENQLPLEITLHQNAISPILLKWSKSFSQETICFSDFLVLDIETTGMMGWGNVYPFLIGLGRISDANVIIQQFLLTQPSQEIAQLLEIEAQLAKGKGLVTYNGKSFDIPIITNRYRYYRTNPPFSEHIHLDLLHLTRRIWRDRLPNRALRNIEAEILDIQRAEDDIPGWLIPQIYSEFLQKNDPQLLLPILYHNQMDVYSLTRLFVNLNNIMENPELIGFDFDEDQFALAKFYENQGYYDRAIIQYQDCIQKLQNQSLLQSILENLALLYKKLKDYPKALPLWEKAAELGSISAHVELAKYYEHHGKEITQAWLWTKRAIGIINQKNQVMDTIHWHPELQYRLERLERIIRLNKIDGGKP
ncbi:MAG: ribonuclease H-like domain-containing protein [Anaerolineales bacterium]